MKPLIHVASLIYNTPLAILPEKFEEIRLVLKERITLNSASIEELARLRALCGRPAAIDEAVLIKAQMDDDDEEDSKPYRLTPEGIAVIPVRGTLLKRNSWLSAASGLTSYQGVKQAATQAMKDPQVKAVMLDVDSPGGTTHGCFELSDALYGLRGDKPMWAVANDVCASAAYSTASAADRVFVTRTGCVGSIGVFAVHANLSEADAQAGIEFSYIFAGAKKIDGNPHQALSKSARADVQAEVDREYAIFVSTVARNRGHAGANVEKVQATEAAVKYGEMAVGILADEVATFDQAMEMLTAKVSGTMLKTSAKLALPQNNGNNAQQQPAADSKEEETKMEKKQSQAEEANKAAVAAAEPDDDPDDEEDGDKKKKDEEDGDEDAKKGNKTRRSAVTEIPVAADGGAKRIAELCQIAGAPELAAEYLVKGYNVETVIQKLSARRAKASEANGAVNSYVSGEQPNAAGRPSVDQAIQQAAVLAQQISAASNGKLTQKQAMAKAMEQILTANPAIYDAYLDERDDVIAKSPSGRGSVLTNYVLNNQRRYLMGMGLSGTIDEMPVRRSMI